MRERTAFDVAGIVQGVGFRPHVARLAARHALGGWVANVAGGVRIEAEGDSAQLAEFAAALVDDAPSRARVERVAPSSCAPLGETEFHIRTLGPLGPSGQDGVTVAADASADPLPIGIDPTDMSMGMLANATPGMTLGMTPSPANGSVPAGMSAGGAIASVASDGATCAACLAEVFDSRDRRHRYPFTSCTDCGPRYSILESLPYERANTSMRHFAPCGACRDEVASPGNRRFHAQANACPDCGPALALLASDGAVLAREEAALDGALTALRDGAVLALKGLGGYQLLVDARRSRAVRELRRRKARPHKPFAVLLADLDALARHGEPSADEAAALGTPAAPIVLVRRRRSPVPETARIARAVAPGSTLLGVMLPCTPLHHLLAREFAAPLVATSGNRSGEPMAIDEASALIALGGIADVFLAHDRPIVRALDDSLERVTAGGVLALRRARGRAPLSIRLPRAVPPVLAVGGNQKTAIALGAGQEIVVGEHLGDLDSAEGRRRHAAAVEALPRLHGVRPTALARDAHPDYPSTRAADALGARESLPVVAVPHHLAHVLACLADNGVEGPALGVAWDGSGHGADGTLWGGEFLHVDGTTVRRVAHLLPFRLPGGERAIREPRRTALGALLVLLGERRFVELAERSDARGPDTVVGASVREATAVGTPSVTPFAPESARSAAIERATLALFATFAPAERRLLAGMTREGVNAPATSSAGRLFDVAAALLGLARRTSFEGQAATMLEQVCDDDAEGESEVSSEVGPELHCELAPTASCLGSTATRGSHGAPGQVETGAFVETRCASAADAPLVLDWRPLLAGMLEAQARGMSKAALARAFHAALTRAIVGVARRVGESRVALTGGCFQNARLLDGTVEALARAGFEPLRHRRVPPNDGGLALGQALAAATALEGRKG